MAFASEIVHFSLSMLIHDEGIERLEVKLGVLQVKIDLLVFFTPFLFFLSFITIKVLMLF